MRAFAIILAGLFCALPVSAAVLETAEDGRALLALRVNDIKKGYVMAVVRETDVLVNVAELEEAGVRGFQGRRETVAGEVYVSLASLAPDLSFEIDPKTSAIAIRAAPALLGRRTIDFAYRRPENIEYATTSSGFLNYSVNWTGSGRLSAFGEVGWTVKGALLTGTVSRDSEGQVVRGLTRAIVDDRSRLRRWTLGDSFAETGPLGGGAFLGGVAVSRNFSLDPYFVRLPRFGLSGAVSTPSTVDVYVNGNLVRREQLPPGLFDLKNIPIVTGSGTTRLVIRDAFGQEREATSPYYFSSGLLAAGISEYSYALGAQRLDLARSSGDYGPLTLLARHRVGLSDSLTAAGRLEATSDVLSGGAGVTAGLPLGEVELGAAWSRERSSSGASGYLSYAYNGRPVAFGASVKLTSDRYSTVSLPSANDRPRTELQGYLSVQAARDLRLAGQLVSERFRDGIRRDRASLSAAYQIGRANLFLGAARSRQDDGNFANEVFGGIAWSFGGGARASVSVQDGRATAEVQQSLPSGPGIGYLAQVREGDGDPGFRGRLQYQSSFGRYELFHDRTGDANSTSFNATGGIVAIGGGLHATRPVRDGFALVQVGGVPGVRGYLSNRPVGRTGSGGNLFVPDLISYYGNRLSISDQDVPDDYAIDATQKLVAPTYRGGAVVRFPVRRIRSLTGWLEIDGPSGTVVPSFGSLVIDRKGGRTTSPLGKKGEFYLDEFSPGQYAAVVEYRDGSCGFTLEVPTSQETFVNLGRIVCSAKIRTAKR
jgi:outer membrane usher protein